MTIPDLDAIERRVADHLGFALSTPQRQRLLRTGQRLMGRHAPGSVRASLPGSAIFDELVESVLVSETYWFRDHAQLDAIAAIMADVAPGGRRIWTAGSSTGQEAYSLAITLHRAGVWPVQIIATDISRPAVEATRRAGYVRDRQRGLDDATADAYGTTRDGIWTPRADLRHHVTALRHDLLRDRPVSAPVILCRNVLIYLTPLAVARALTQLDQGLERGGTLVTGHAETQLPGLRWRSSRHGDTFVFRRAADLPGPTRPVAQVTPSPPPTSARAPQRAPEASEPSADALLRAGERALEAGHHSRAIQLLRQARYLRGRDPVPAVLLGVALARAGYAVDARRSLMVGRDLLAAVPDGTPLTGGYPPAAVQRWVEDLHARGIS